MAIHGKIFFAAINVFLFFNASNLWAADYKPTPWEQPYDSSNTSTPLYYVSQPYPSAPLYHAQIPVDATLDMRHFIEFDPFTLTIHKPERVRSDMVGVITVTEGKTEKKLFSFSEEMFDYVKDVVIKARQSNTMVLINRSKSDRVTSLDNLPTQIQRTQSPIPFTWSQYNYFGYDEGGLMTTQFIWFKAINTSRAEKYPIEDSEKFRQIIAVAASAQNAQKRIEINIHALSSKRHLAYLPVEFIIRVAP